MRKTTLTLTSALALSLLAGTAFAAECDTVIFSDVGWTDITTTTATTKHILEALGYEVDVKVLSVPVTYASLESDDVDVFLGTWLPAQQGVIGPYLDSGEVEKVATNLTGTKYTLAVPAYTFDKGLTDYSKIAEFGESLENTIYGIEPGNEGNGYLIGLVDANTHGLGEFKVVESSEQGMLAEVDRAVKENKDVVFLGWEPHPMNTRNKMKYLSGGDEYFGPNYGQATVYTNVRKDYLKECSNVGKFLQNMEFSLAMENQLMDAVLNQNQKPRAAAKAWLKANPAVLETWLAGVSSRDGQDGLKVASTRFQ
jgi:glycine betaine/proline transport system substrate-binding protein